MNAIIYHEKAQNIAQLLPAESVQTVVTSPPYFGLRDYGVDGQIGLEATPKEYVNKLVEVFRAVRQVLRSDGTVWLNLGDSYNGSGGAGGDYYQGGLKEGQPRYPGRRINGLKPKDLIGIPWHVAFALQADGWYLRADIIWSKPNPMPESVSDRPTKAHEYIFLLTKEPRYYYNADAIREPHKTESNVRNPRSESYGQARIQRPRGGGPVGDGYREFNHPLGRNKRSVWTIATQAFPEAHFATFPERLPELCILAGSRPGDTVLDPFVGSGTTLLVAERLGRRGVGTEINPDYIEIAKRRLSRVQLAMNLEVAPS